MTARAATGQPPIPLITGYDPAAAGHPFLAGDARARSLNRARIAAQPDATLDEDLSGRSAYELLSAAAHEALVRAASAKLGICPDSPQLLRDFDGCFQDRQFASAAHRVAGVVGRRLGAVLLVLARGEAADRRARPEWGDDQWAYWRDVRRVIVGGGLWAGNLGAAAAPVAAAFLAEAGCPITVERSPWGAAVVLAGLARHAPPDARRMLLFDFGQTNLKRGMATYSAGILAGIEPRPPIPAPCPGRLDGAAGDARRQWAAMRDTILADWRHVPPGETGGTAIGLALAAHLQDGHPFATDQGCYGRLQSLAPHLASFISADLSGHVGRFCALALIHDGLAAAATVAGEAHTVVITLGTALGAGYPPTLTGLRPVAGSDMLT